MGDGPEGVPARPSHKKLVGINYPWFKYGYDFGNPPPMWIEKKEKVLEWIKKKKKEKIYEAQEKWKKNYWTPEVNKDITELKNLGISIVRWFILADGLTYGIDDKAPHQDPKRKDQWRFDDPPKLTKQFEEDFKWVLQTLQDNNMRFVPSLIDFQWCWPGKLMKDSFVKRGVKRGRSDVINDKSKREKFFNRVLKPLLNFSNNYKETIYAWELINEPEGATIGSGEGEDREKHKEKGDKPYRKTTVGMEEMLEFIEEGIGIINQAKFDSTVGYRRLETIKNWKGKNHRYLGVKLHQFHFYPKGKWYDFIPWFRDDLPKHTFHKKWPCFIGEFATALEDKFQWPEIKKSKQTVYHRLKAIESKGYPVAFPWAMIERSEEDEKKEPEKRPAHDWSDSTKRSIKRYIYKKP